MGAVALETRREAHTGAKATQAATHARILEVMGREGRKGLSADRAATILGISLLTTRPAFTVLRQIGAIVETGTTVKTAAGRLQAVYVTKENEHGSEGDSGEPAGD